MRLVLLFILTTRLFAYPSTILDSAYDKLDLEYLDHTIQKYKFKPPVNSDEKNEEILSLFFRAERAYFEREPHAALFYLNKAEKICDASVLPPNSAGLLLACALVYSELSTHHNAFFKLIYLKKAVAALETGKKTSRASEVFYVEGRVLLRSGDTVDPRLGKSLLNFQMLLRSEPEITQTSYWIAYAYQQSGNEKAHEEWLLTALKTNNIRTKLMYGSSQSALRNFIDGLGFGNAFGFYANQLDGAGAVYKIWDDRILDKRRSAAILLSASTNKNFGVGAVYADSELFDDYTIGVGSSVQYEFDQYYGRGLTSLLSDRSISRIQSSDAHLEFSRELARNISFSVGWEVHQRHLHELVSGPFAVLSEYSGENVFYSGGYFSALWDTMDSEDYSRSGGKISLKGYFPTKDFLSSWTFQKWNATAEINTTLFGVLTKLKVGSSVVSIDAPLDALIEVKSDLQMPGTRPLRYRDVHLSGSAIELKHKLFGPFVVGGYSTVLLPAFEFNKTKLGFGALVEAYLTSFKKKQARVEIGTFNSEFIFGLDLGFGL